VTALETAARLEPGRSARWVDLAQALLSMESPAVTEARRALARAQAADPTDLNVRYWLGRADLAEGNPVGAGQQWRSLMVDLPVGDPRRSALLADLEALEGSRSQPQPDVAAMVEGLARRLEQAPDDPAGWARLARAYAVLGREQDLQAALARSRRLFADRPEALARIEAEAEAGRRVQQGR
jgi:cytochrome c-type biogenesis protein CcmH